MFVVMLTVNNDVVIIDKMDVWMRCAEVSKFRLC